MQITKFIDRFTDYLADVFEDYKGLSYKCNNDPASGDNTSQPHIYTYTMPSSDLTGNFPNKSPVIVITIDELIGRSTYRVSLHTCVRYDAVSEAEKVKRIDGSEFYEYLEGNTYDTNADIELYKSSLSFVEFLHNKVLNYTENTLTDISVELPDSTNGDFPYSTAAIHFSVDVNAFAISQNPYHSYY